MTSCWRLARSLVLVSALTATSAALLPSVGSARAAVQPPAGFVYRSGSQLLLDGQPYRFTGLNLYNATVRSNCVSGYSAGNADGVLDRDLNAIDAGTGARSKVLRAWFFQHQATRSGARDWAAFDHTLSVARAHGFKVIATLTNQWSDCEEPDADKDLNWYRDGYRTTVPASGTTTYRSYVQEVTARYRNDPTVLAWQLVNEGNGGNADRSCSAGSTPATTLQSWATDVAGLVKATDPNHLVSIGALNNSCGTWQGENVTLSNVPGNDLCEFHDYANLTAAADLPNLVKGCNGIGRPTFIGETGVTLASVSGNLATRASQMDTRMAQQFSAGAVGVLPWTWNGSTTSVDALYDIKPGDPLLGVLGKYGTTAPVVDAAAPTVAVSSPGEGSTVTGQVTISASASDDVGVRSVQFLVDGVALSTSTAPPYTASWTTTSSGNGAHVLQVRATDGSGNVGTASRSVTVSNPVVTTWNDNTLGSGPGQFAYAGTWQYSAGTPAKYAGDDHYSAAAGATSTFAFTGRSVKLFGSRASHHGIVAVSIDGGPESLVDYYAATRVDGALLWTSPALAAAPHSLRLRVTGTRNAASSGTVVTVDRVDVTS